MIGAGSSHVGLVIGTGLHTIGAVVCATVAVWLGGRRERFGNAGAAIIVALAMTAVWCVTVAATGEARFVAGVAEAARNIAWLFAIFSLFASDGRGKGQAPIRPLAIVLAVVEVVQLFVNSMAYGFPATDVASRMIFDVTVLFRLLVAVGVLVLVHNLYAGASQTWQAGLKWLTTGLAVLFAMDLNLYAIAYLVGHWPSDIEPVRAVGAIALACLVAIGASKDRDALRIRPSRMVAFQSFSLIIIGLYLVAMVAIARWLALAGGDYARLLGLAFLTMASSAAILVLPSPRLRGWIKVMLAKHMFQHRYDYRVEWLRFTRTIGSQGESSEPLGARVVKAVADIAESPAGLLLAPDERGELVLAARWNWPEIEVPASAMSRDAAAFFGKDGFIADLDDVRAGQGEYGEQAHIPAWLRDHPRAWALVPLVHFEQLVGLVILSRPPLARKFDWEDFDLLRVAGQQLASYLAEHSGQEALAESSRFDDFNRRIAFVMHDIKNLASQLSLLARNAELHAENPEFRKDMLVTLTNSADKLNTLLARLSRYGGGAVQGVAPTAAGAVLRAAVARFGANSTVAIAECNDCMVIANAESLEQVLVHLIQNGIDASPPGAPVFVSLTHDNIGASLEVVDSGSGMSADFVRSKLFKPFVSSKPGGFGIGAFEARELVGAMRGRLEVESREGLGSRFAVRLPLRETAALFENFASSELRVA